MRGRGEKGGRRKGEGAGREKGRERKDGGGKKGGRGKDGRMDGRVTTKKRRGRRKEKTDERMRGG